MPDNVILHASTRGPVRFAAELAARAGDDLGLVLTSIEFHQEKISGGRVEEDRSYAGTTFQTFDEPVFIGSAIAQLAGHADAVVLDGIEDWAARLLRRFPDDPIALDAEIASLVSVMKARMSELVLIVRRDAAATPAAAELTRRILGIIDPHAQTIVDVGGSVPRVSRGSLSV